MNNLLPCELKALYAFVSHDQARPHLTVAWHYPETAGQTHVATDGHSMVIRYEGKDVCMLASDISQRRCTIVIPRSRATLFGRDEPRPGEFGKPPHDRKSHHIALVPPAWHALVRMYDTRGSDTNNMARSIDPALVGRVHLVEKAFREHRRSVYRPKPGMTKQHARDAREVYAPFVASLLTIPASEWEPWVWRLGTKENDVRWEVYIMPRRVLLSTAPETTAPETSLVRP